jgi:hypothetical protein
MQSFPLDAEQNQAQAAQNLIAILADHGHKVGESIQHSYTNGIINPTNANTTYPVKAKIVRLPRKCQ